MVKSNEEATTLINEVLDSEGWALLLDVFSRTIYRRRQRLFDGVGEMTTDVEVLKAMKALLQDIYKEGGIDMPNSIAALFR